LIVVRSHIGYGSPNKHDTAEAHGSALGDAEILLTKKALGYPSMEPFWVAPEALRYWRDAGKERAKTENDWNKIYEAWKAANSGLAKELDRRLRGELPDGWEELIPVFTAKDGNVASLLNPALDRMSQARLPGIVDVTSGNNTVSFSQGGKVHTVTGFSARAGYGLVTGIGTVNGALFVPELARTALS